MSGLPPFQAGFYLPRESDLRLLPRPGLDEPSASETTDGRARERASKPVFRRLRQAGPRGWPGTPLHSRFCHANRRRAPVALESAPLFLRQARSMERVRRLG